MDQFLLGDILFCWDGGGYTLGKGEFMEKFRYFGSWTGERRTFRGSFLPLSPYRDFPLLTENEIVSVYDVQGERLLLYHWRYLRDGFGIWLDRLNEDRDDVVSFDPGMKEQQPMTADWFFGVSGLHKALLNMGRPVLHAACVDIGGSAVLFTAPSGTGKSTQAELWRKYAGAEIINGDRVLLGKRDGIWHAYGFPNCGSSRICVNRTLPLRAIISLTQGKENALEEMRTVEKLRSLVSGIAIYKFESSDIAQASALAGSILSEVEMIRLVCRPDAEAVYVLKEYLEGYGNGAGK